MADLIYSVTDLLGRGGISWEAVGLHTANLLTRPILTFNHSMMLIHALHPHTVHNIVCPVETPDTELEEFKPLNLSALSLFYNCVLPIIKRINHSVKI